MFDICTTPVEKTVKLQLLQKPRKHFRYDFEPQTFYMILKKTNTITEISVLNRKKNVQERSVSNEQINRNNDLS